MRNLIEDLIEKIDTLLGRKIERTGFMGTEIVTVRIQLSEEEVQTFLSIEKFDTKNYFWELEDDTDTLILSYQEQPSMRLSIF